jgi:hypothetical protein
MERKKLKEASENSIPWKKWGPYLSERQWGTVREDYSAGGDAWNYFTHDMARSRAYQWGEDGLAGISDDQQQLCFAIALWNGNDPILKERLFGLTNGEGNHGEDVKEYYFYLDSTPTHSYMKYLYKYPQRAYPYADLINANRNRGHHEREFELLDTGVFNDDRYFDVFVEYAKVGAEDILVRVTACNRGPEAAPIHILPTLWFRNNWYDKPGVIMPDLHAVKDDATVLKGSHPSLGEFTFTAYDTHELLFTNNETNKQKLWGVANVAAFVKDGINNYIVNGETHAVNPSKNGTKAAAHYTMQVPAGKSAEVYVWLTMGDVSQEQYNQKKLANIFDQCKKDADEFYAGVIPASLNADETNVIRQALSGMLWSKQFYYYDVNKWLKQHGVDVSKSGHHSIRNAQWAHMENAHIISMPDKWEYPWYAAWDLAFHVQPLMLVDEDFAKGQLELMLDLEYQHPNGQIPAYEWNFGDVNPPVHAWSTIFSYFIEKSTKGKGDLKWLEACFHKLLLNFNWWVNRKDRDGSNVFEGGFLGLDNIGVFDRSSPLPTGGFLEQADGTAWMTLFSQNMLEIATQLAMENPAYEGITKKFFEHFLIISSAMIKGDQDGSMWDEKDGFFYDVLRLPDGSSQRLKVRSMVGLLPLCACTVFDREMAKKFPEMPVFVRNYLEARPELTAFIHNPGKEGKKGRLLASVLNETNFKRVLSVMLDENEFLGPYGIRALSRLHKDHPFILYIDGKEYRVDYMPGESGDNMFGGNSNWRGPVWMPVNMLIIRALLNYYSYYGNDLKVECPTRSGNYLNLYEVAKEITNRLSAIFLMGENGNRPVYGGNSKFQEDPYWKDLILFHEYFDGDNGSGVGASHQTGWTGVVARLMHFFAVTTMEDALTLGKDVMLKSGNLQG